MVRLGPHSIMETTQQIAPDLYEVTVEQKNSL